RGAAGHPARPDRGGHHRRGQPVAGVPPRDLPGAEAGHRRQRRLAEHYRAAAVRSDLHDHPRRPAELQSDHRLLRLRARLPDPALRVRRGRCVRAVRAHHAAHHRDDPLLPASQDRGVLMSILFAPSAAAPDPVAGAEARRPGPPRRRLLPFSAWHLLLMPMALVFVLPLLQMILTSFMTAADINRFPPRFIPTQLSLSGYRALLGESHILRWLLNTVIVAT